ncbi:MAG: hypothetical protein GDA56_20305 [Hormoscilla sp. GM7CHS1pb]|nr:hypothetical protein [Hormoscilla sp. GM7CHS1pb]
MKYKLFTPILTLVTIALALGPAAKPSVANSKQFFCGRSKGKPATIVRSGQENAPIIIWDNSSLDASQWPPLRRCEEVSRRFQEFEDRDLLGYIKTGTVNRYPVLCAANYKGGDCPSTQVLITLAPGSDADEYLRSLLRTRDRSRGRTYFTSEVLFYEDNGVLDADMNELIKAIKKENSQSIDGGSYQPIEPENSQESNRVW